MITGERGGAGGWRQEEPAAHGASAGYPAVDDDAALEVRTRTARSACARSRPEAVVRYATDELAASRRLARG